MGSNEMCMEATGAVRVVSRRMVRPSSSGGATPSEDIHLTPWDLRLLTIEYVQMGVLLPAPPVGGDRLVQALASSLARTLGRYYHFAGRLAVDNERGDGTVTVRLRCTGEGAELVHAAAPGVAVNDVVGSVYSPSKVVWEFFPLNGVLNADAAVESLPVLSAQLTELADGVFVGVSMNHSVGDGTTFWEFFNAWSEIHRGRSGGADGVVSAPEPVHGRWFLDTSPVPIPLPFAKLQHLLQRFELPPVGEAFFTFSAATVKKLKARANDEMAGIATAPISSLQALLAHLWRAVCRARRLKPGQETFYKVIIGGRGRVSGIPPGYVGSAPGAQQRGLRRRRHPRQGAGLDGVAAEPRRGLVRRGGVDGVPRPLGPGADVLLHREPLGRQRGDRDGGLAAFRRVRERLRVGHAAGRADRPRRQDGRGGHSIRGTGPGWEHVAGGVLGAGGAREARRRRRVHGRRHPAIGVTA